MRTRLKSITRAAKHMHRLYSVATTPSTLKIRFAVPADVPAISFCNRLSLPENYDAKYLHDYVRRWPSLSLVVVDRYNMVQAYTIGRIGDVYDHTFAPADFGFLTSIAVLPEVQKLGIGKKLMQALHKNCVSMHGLKHILLHCRDTNLGAVKFYHSLGYKVEKVLKDYYADQGTALLMKKFFSHEDVTSTEMTDGQQQQVMMQI